MASSYSNLGLDLQVTGSNNNTWGEYTNTNLQLIDQAIAGYSTVQCNSTTITLAFSTNNSSTTFFEENGRNKILKFTSGSASADITVTVPNIEKEYIVENQSGYNITFTAGGSTTYTLDTDRAVPLYIDGSQGVYNSFNKLRVNTIEADNVLGGADPIVFAVALG